MIDSNESKERKLYPNITFVIFHFPFDVSKQSPYTLKQVNIKIVSLKTPLLQPIHFPSQNFLSISINHSIPRISSTIFQNIRDTALKSTKPILTTAYISSHRQKTHECKDVSIVRCSRIRLGYLYPIFVPQIDRPSIIIESLLSTMMIEEAYTREGGREFGFRRSKFYRCKRLLHAEMKLRGRLTRISVPPPRYYAAPSIIENCAGLNH